MSDLSPTTDNSTTQLAKSKIGGVFVTDDDLSTAWKYFDPKSDGKTTASDLRRRLLLFYKHVTHKEIKYLMNNKTEISFNEVAKMLKDNQISQFDPVKEAFKIFDPNETGFLQTAVLRDFFKASGFAELSEEDLSILMQFADRDKDGRIGLEDFRHLVPLGRDPRTLP